MSEQKNAPPPPPTPVQDEKPKLAEPEVSEEPAELPEGDSSSDTKPKEIPAEVPTPKSQADLGTNADLTLTSVQRI